LNFPYVCVCAEEEEKGFYNEKDPAWRVVFAEKPIEVRKLDGFLSGFAYVKIGITRTADSGEKPKLQVYSQDVMLSAGGGNISGWPYPELELQSAGPEGFAGRIHLAKPAEFFDDKYQYDFSFRAPLSDPHAPIGDPLPAGGGEPGKSYLSWLDAVRSGDIDRIKAMLPPEKVEMLEAEDAKESIEFLQIMTPGDVKILGGSSDGSTPIQKVEGTMDDSKMFGEITLTKQGESWVTTEESWKLP